jgi:hypothetical protein
MTRASLFLRFNLPEFFWTAQLKRVERELKLLRPREIFHVWFHPHNLGAQTSLRLSRVEQFLDFIAEAQHRRRIASYSMADLEALDPVRRFAMSPPAPSSFERERALATA